MASSGVEKEEHFYGEEGCNATSLDLFVPLRDGDQKEQLLPLVIFIHGGLWISRDKKESDHIGRYFAERGKACAVLNYPLSDSSDSSIRHPVHTQAVAKGVDWIFEKGKELSISLSNVILMGHSCGAHMIGLLTLSDYLASKNKIITCIGGCIGIQEIGIYSTSLFCKDFPEWAPHVYHSMTTDETKWESPVDHKGDGKNREKWILFHSLEDKWVNEKQARVFEDHLSQLQIKVEVNTSIKGEHMDTIQNFGKENDQLAPLVMAFISSIQKTELEKE